MSPYVDIFLVERTYCLLTGIAAGVSTVVKHLPNHPEVEGSSRASTTGTESVKHLQVLHSRVGSWPYPGTLGSAEKADQGRIHQLNMKFTELKIFIAFGPERKKK